MSWVRDSNLSWVQRFAIKVIKCGRIPRHVAFIMDGNRRYAKKLHLKTSTEGHIHGFDKLAEALQWCLDIGIEEVTVYAFSIENFKRSKNEVDALLEMAREKFTKFMEEKDRLNERGICFRLIGNWSLLPPDLQKCAAEAMLLTKNNNKAVLNVAFAYTSRDEMTHSIKDIVEGIKCDKLLVDDLSDDLITQCMYSGQSRDLDLLVRTSGESRLSDFLLWQASTAIVYFVPALWPEFSFWQLIAGVIYYQRYCGTIEGVKKSLQHWSTASNDPVQQSSNHSNCDRKCTTALQSNERVKKFLENLHSEKHNQLVKFSHVN